MSDDKNIRIFCPTHEVAFEAANSPKILCEITDHALSIDFPNSDFWEFCCNCETFSPAKLDKGENARSNCYACGNEISKRFACVDCNVIGFESTAKTKGKSFFINEKGLGPACPGCQKPIGSKSTILHKCTEIEAEFFTERSDCPFCLEKVLAEPSPQRSDAINRPSNCPKCHVENIPNALFCSKCGYQLRTDVVVTNLGTNVYKTQLLGSLCPNCSVPVLADSVFCSDCGQAVKKSFPPPPPPKPAIETEKLDLSKPHAEVSTVNNSLRNVGIGIVGVFILLVVSSFLLSVSKSTNSSSVFTNAKPTKSVAKTASQDNTSTAEYPIENNQLADVFDREYEGSINGRSLTMSLVRSGRELKGTASTSTNTDSVEGTIEPDGEFKMNGNENGDRFTGIYSGQINNDGSITGRWTTPQGTKSTSFSLEER